MKSRAFRLAPAVAALTAGLLLAGASGAAVATPSENSPSASSDTANKSDNELARAGWQVRSKWYHDQGCCYEAGNLGQHYGDWHEYDCKRKQDNHGHRWWWLYTK